MVRITNKRYSTVNGRQSYVTKSGRKWEDEVKDFVNKRLQSHGSELTVIRGNEIPKNSELWRKLAIPVGKPDSREKIWGDVDLVVVEKNQNPVGVISCKTSLHGRLSESLFYAVVLKDLVPGIKFVLATSDKGRQQKSGVWESEWASRQKPTKDRLLGSHYLDGAYVLKRNIKMGGMIERLGDLSKDLMKWYRKLRRHILY